MSWLSGMSPSEKRVVKICVLLMLLCLPFLLDEDLLARLLGREKEAVGQQIGRIASAQRDVRRKGSNELQWRGVGKEQAVYMGDSVFAGDGSSAKIALDGANELTIAPNSLVRFANINGFRVGDMALGTFKVQVDGEVKVAVNGKLKTFKGRKSEIEVVVKKNAKPVIRVTKGEAKIAEVPVVREIAAVEPVPVPKPEESPLIYIWKWPDYYAPTEPIFAKSVRPKEVILTHVLSWEAPEGEFSVQASDRADFLGPRNYFETEANAVEIRKVYLGPNYWRVSRDKRRWSKVAKFEVRPVFLDERVTIQPSTQDLIILDVQQGAIMQAMWNADPSIIKLLVELSTSPDFPREGTRVEWINGLEQVRTFTRAGTYYLRARGINERQEITEYSNTLTVNVTAPEKLAAPEMPRVALNYNLFSDQPNFLVWRGPAGAQDFDVEVMDESGEVIARKSSNKQKLPLKNLKPGVYSYRVTANDKWQRPGAPSVVKPFEVMAPPPAPLAVHEPEPEPPPALKERKTAAVEPEPTSTNIMQLEETPQGDFMNKLYGDSVLAVEGATFGLMSSEQTYQGSSVPYAATMALRGKHWSGSYGAEGVFKSKVFNYNSEGSRISPWGIEARVLRKWRTPWKWFSFLREAQLTAIAGGELYRNRGGGVFSNGYELLKFGGGLEFPLWNRWATGGEVLYGYGLDASQKLEVSGFVNYFLRKQWALGMGYRVHFFDAGSLESSPGYVPYREGYLEGYSTIRYQY